MRDWQDLAECRSLGPARFFPGRGEPNDEALELCKACPVRFQCLDFAMREHITFGVWGGKSEKQRRVLRSQPRELVLIAAQAALEAEALVLAISGRAGSGCDG